MRKIFVTSLRVQSHELDSFGHVNNAVYLNYLESARCDYMRQVGLSFNDFNLWNAYPVVVEASLRYYHPLITDDIIEIHGTFPEFKHSQFRLDYEIYKQKNIRVLTAQIKFIFIDNNGKSIRVPEMFQKPFSKQE